MTVLFTIGHGDREIGEFISLLREAGIECLVDVRAYPASRRHPQFARQALEHSLAEAGIRFLWEGGALGGRRTPSKDSPHTALRNPGFRAYADYTLTAQFQHALDRLLKLASNERVAILCAERMPWQCHRNLIADSVVARGNRVMHLIESRKSREHQLHQAARMEQGKVVYDKNENLGLEFN